MKRKPISSVMPLALVAFICLSDGSTARAQFQQNDPFSLYYGFYLPRQAAIASQPKATDTINYLAAERQRSAQIRSRTPFADPFSAFGLDEFGEYGGSGQLFERDRQGGGVQRGTKRILSPTGITSTRTQSGGLPGRFSNTQAYYPSPRPDQHANRNIAISSGLGRARGFGGGGGFGGFGS